MQGIFPSVCRDSQGPQDVGNERVGGRPVKAQITQHCTVPTNGRCNRGAHAARAEATVSREAMRDSYLRKEPPPKTFPLHCELTAAHLLMGKVTLGNGPNQVQTLPLECSKTHSLPWYSIFHFPGIYERFSYFVLQQ